MGEPTQVTGLFVLGEQINSFITADFSTLFRRQLRQMQIGFEAPTQSSAFRFLTYTSLKILSAPTLYQRVAISIAATISCALVESIPKTQTSLSIIAASLIVVFSFASKGDILVFTYFVFHTLS